MLRAQKSMTGYSSNKKNSSLSLTPKNFSNEEIFLLLKRVVGLKPMCTTKHDLKPFAEFSH